MMTPLTKPGRPTLPGGGRRITWTVWEEGDRVSKRTGRRLLGPPTSPYIPSVPRSRRGRVQVPVRSNPRLGSGWRTTKKERNYTVLSVLRRDSGTLWTLLYRGGGTLETFLLNSDPVLLNPVQTFLRNTSPSSLTTASLVSGLIQV